MLANIMLDRHGRVRGWNGRAQALFRCAGDAVIGRPYSTLVAFASDADAAAVLARSRETGCAEHEGRCLRPDGSLFSAQALVTPVAGDHGPAAYSLVVVDVTDDRARHAQARNVVVSARAEEARLRVTVRDDGVGIRIDNLESRNSYGLLGIRERAQTLGGFAEIHALDGGGTAVDIDVPIPQEPSGELKR